MERGLFGSDPCHGGYKDSEVFCDSTPRIPTINIDINGNWLRGVEHLSIELSDPF